ncbi:hypothetical protein [Streptomyces sp. NPDC087272]|uniref:hypothetical protein n=1 Tax=Streptomyces sp. NPDC087272 TaxID=3365775 RepID=UPI0038252B94
MTEVLTPEQMYRALDYVLAVDESDNDAMHRLEDNGRPPMRYLLADVLDLIVRSVSAAEELDAEARQDRQDHAAALGGILTRAVHEWATTAQPDLPEESPGQVEIPEYRHASEGIARTVGAYVLAVLDGDHGDLRGRLEPIRAAWTPQH